MEIKIEKGVPIPKRPKRKDKHLFIKMEVGDSFIIPSDWMTEIWYVEGGVRIWRTA
jgi:hypothetical protein